MCEGRDDHRPPTDAEVLAGWAAIGNGLVEADVARARLVLLPGCPATAVVPRGASEEARAMMVARLVFDYCARIYGRAATLALMRDIYGSETALARERDSAA